MQIRTQTGGAVSGARDRPADLAALAEQLWGPRDAHLTPRRAQIAPPPTGDNHETPPTVPGAAFRLAKLEQEVLEQMADLRESTAVRQAEWLGRARAEIEALRSGLVTALKGEVARIRAELGASVAATEPSIEAALGHLEKRLDAMDNDVAEAAAKAVEAVEARLDGLREQIREGVAGLERSLEAKQAGWVERLRAEIRELRTEMQSGVNLGPVTTSPPGVGTGPSREEAAVWAGSSGADPAHMAHR